MNPVADRGSGENDAAYWYDLPGTDSGEDAPPHAVEETRGPFEPLVSSADPPGTPPRFSAGPRPATPPAPTAPNLSRRTSPTRTRRRGTTGQRTRCTPTRASSSRSRTCT